MILVVGDLHFRDRLSYSDYINRDTEKDEILNFIIDQSEDCDSVVFVGDIFDRRDPVASVNREACAFFERFKRKQLYIISGNHDKKASGGTTALDYLREIGDKHWKIFTRPQSRIEIQGRTVDFLPYMYKGELGVENTDTAVTEIMSHLQEADILFHHHSVSDTMAGDVSTNTFSGEIVLPKAELEQTYKLVVGGHIHSPGIYGRTVVTGSVFNTTVGESGKILWKIDPKNLSVKQIKLPGRGIYKVEVDSLGAIPQLPKNSIVKCIVKDRSVNIEELKKHLSQYDAHLIVEQYPDEREVVHFEEGALDLDIETLLGVYATARGVDEGVLLRGYELIK